MQSRRLPYAEFIGQVLLLLWAIALRPAAGVAARPAPSAPLEAEDTAASPAVRAATDPISAVIEPRVFRVLSVTERQHSIRVAPDSPGYALRTALLFGPEAPGGMPCFGGSSPFLHLLHVYRL